MMGAAPNGAQQLHMKIADRPGADHHHRLPECNAHRISGRHGPRRPAGSVSARTSSGTLFRRRDRQPFGNADIVSRTRHRMVMPIWFMSAQLSTS
jgi:hypothetical protein